MRAGFIYHIRIIKRKDVDTKGVSIAIFTIVHSLVYCKPSARISYLVHLIILQFLLSPNQKL